MSGKNGNSLAKTNGTALQKSTDRTQVDRDLSHQMLGAAKYANFLRQQTASDLMNFLIEVRDGKRFIDYGCTSMDEFLDSEHSPVASSTFYRKLELFQREDPQLYDLLEEWKVPARLRLLLEDGDVRIDKKGNVLLGGEKIESNGTIAKQVIERLVREKIDLQKQALKGERAEIQVGHLKDKLAEAEEQLKTLTSGTVYEQSLGQLMTALLQHTMIIRELDPNEHAAVAGPDLAALQSRWNELEAIYSVDTSAAYFKADAGDGENF